LSGWLPSHSLFPFPRSPSRTDLCAMTIVLRFSNSLFGRLYSHFIFQSLSFRPFPRPPLARDFARVSEPVLSSAWLASAPMYRRSSTSLILFIFCFSSQSPSFVRIVSGMPFSPQKPIYLFRHLSEKFGKISYFFFCFDDVGPLLCFFLSTFDARTVHVFELVFVKIALPTSRSR